MGSANIGYLMAGVIFRAVGGNSMTGMKADKLTWAGRALTALALPPFLVGIYMTLTKNPQALEGMARFGWPESTGTTILALQLGCLALYLIPQTAVLGVVLLTGYLGGAVATHLRVGDSVVVPLVVAAIAWGGLYLREPRLRALLPLRSRP
jgi:hypothetical protein